MKPLWWFVCAGIGFAALFGLLWGGGANASHEAQPDAAVNTGTTVPAVNELPPGFDIPTTTTTEAPYVEPAPPPAQPRPSVARPAASGSGACGKDWDCFRECTIDHESRNSGMYTTNTGNGYAGAYQFLQSTWDNAVTGAGYGEWAGRPANEAPPEVQDAAARWLWERSGTQPWGGRCG